MIADLRQSMIALLRRVNTWTAAQTFSAASTFVAATFNGLLTATAGLVTNALTFNSSVVSDLVVQREIDTYTANTSIATAIPIDDTIPQVGDGTEILSVVITPKKAGNIIRVEFQGFCGVNAGGNSIAALFLNGGANAVQVTSHYDSIANAQHPMHLVYEYAAADVAADTLSVRVGPATAASLRMNGTSAGRLFGGAAAATLTVTEYAA